MHATARGDRDRLRGWLDRALFVEDTTRLGVGPAGIVAAAGLAVLGVLAVLARLGFDPPLSVIWAEDGPIFYGGTFDHGFFSALATNYAGYAQLLPRLLAEPIAALPIGWAPEALAIAGSIVVVGCAFIVWRASAPQLPDRRARALLGAMVVLAPVVGFESLANITYAQWFLIFPAFWLVLWRPPGLGAAIGSGCFLFVAMTSAPLTLALAPLGALRAYAARDARDWAIAGGFGLGVAAFLYSVLANDSANTIEPGWDFRLLAAYPLRVVAPIGLGIEVDGAVWKVLGPATIVLASLAMIGLTACAALRATPGRALSLIAIALSLAMYFVAGYQRDLGEGLLWPAGADNSFHARYTIAPFMLLLTAVLIQLRDRPPQLAPPRWGRIQSAALAVIALGALSSFYVGDALRESPDWSSEVSRAKAACELAPAGSAELSTSPPGWMVTVPCDKLL